MNLQALKILGEEGFIPGPDESEASFVKRVDTLRALAAQSFPCNYKELGAKPKWIPLKYSNHRLLPWQGAVSWTQTTSKGTHIPMIQLRKGFQKGHFLHYNRDEVLRHEAIHALRTPFNEPRFEEILAYFHSPKGWRKFLGPLFRKPSQALVFISMIFISLLLQTASLFLWDSPIFPFLKVLAFLPLIYLLFRTVALLRDQRIFNRALKTLQDLFPSQSDSFPIAIRLKDEEIQMFAKKSVDEVLPWIYEKMQHSLRWQQILAQFS